MTVNKNIRCIEWFDADRVVPLGDRFVLGWYDDDHIRIVRRFSDGRWWLSESGPGCRRQEFAKPTHWCEFPEGPAQQQSPEPK